MLCILLTDKVTINCISNDKSDIVTEVPGAVLCLTELIYTVRHTTCTIIVLSLIITRVFVETALKRSTLISNHGRVIWCRWYWSHLKPSTWVTTTSQMRVFIGWKTDCCRTDHFFASACSRQNFLVKVTIKLAPFYYLCISVCIFIVCFVLMEVYHIFKS